MKFIKQSCEILQVTNPRIVELAGRTCCKSEDKINDVSYKNFIKGIIFKGHESVIEHSLMTVKFVTSRDITHELVRHRLASYSQESTRYVNYKNKGIEFVIPYWAHNIERLKDTINNHEPIQETDLTKNEWALIDGLHACERTYLKLIDAGLKPEAARSILPNCLKAEIVVSANFREWRHILKLRMYRKAHPQIQMLMIDLYNKIRVKYPDIFNIFFRDLLNVTSEEKQL